MGQTGQAAAAAEVYEPRSLQVWRSLVNWLGFLVQMFLQILRGTPCVAQVLSYVGLSQHLLAPSSSTSFKPLPVAELPLRDFSSSSSSSAARISVENGDCDSPLGHHRRVKKLTVRFFFVLTGVKEKDALDSHFVG